MNYSKQLRTTNSSHCCELRFNACLFIHVYCQSLLASGISDIRSFDSPMTCWSNIGVSGASFRPHSQTATPSVLCLYIQANLTKLYLTDTNRNKQMAKQIRKSIYWISLAQLRSKAEGKSKSKLVKSDTLGNDVTECRRVTRRTNAHLTKYNICTQKHLEHLRFW